MLARWTNNRDSFDDLFESIFIKPMVNYGVYNNVKIDSNDDDYTLQMVMAGVNKKDIEVLVKDDTLTISHNVDEEKEKNGFVSSFKKVYKIPDECDRKKINSKLSDGILTVVLPKQKNKIFEQLIQIE